MTLPIQQVNQEPIREARQLLVTIANSWDAIHGQLLVLERSGDSWRPVRDAIPVTLGKNGLQWAQGLVEWSASETKKEGDWKTPVGAFTLSGAYGYADASAAAFVQMPYLPVTKQHKAVDDPNSRYYNQIVREDLVAEKDWQSAEEMKRDDHLYKWGIVVDFNRKHIIPGGGSCIFMHLWRNPDRYTAGCTAMTEEDMLFLLRWLRPVPKPVLVQADKKKMNLLLEALGLHSIISLLP